MFLVRTVNTTRTLGVGWGKMGARVQRLFVRDEDCFVDAADVEDFGWTKLRAENVDRATGFAEHAVCRDGDDIESVMRDSLKSHLRLKLVCF